MALTAAKMGSFSYIEAYWAFNVLAKVVALSEHYFEVHYWGIGLSLDVRAMLPPGAL